MQSSPQWIFGLFRFDPANACLWHGAQALPLMPITCALLECLVAHAGQLVTKDALLEAVWPETAVSDAVLKVRISELRKLLGDTAKAPRYIATVHRRGYRFIAPATTADPSTLLGAAPSPLPPRAVPLVGREAALAQLQHWLARACQGERQVVFVTGEAGIGKTALVEAFLTQVRAAPHLWVAHGQCVEHYGVGEAYLPMLEALGRLCRAPERELVVALLRQRAPLWLVQLPWLLSAAEQEALQRALWGATRERMLREMAEALEALTAERPLVLVFEDLHWSDYATLDLLAVLARRQEPARLLLLGTYRPEEVVGRAHPLQAVKHELQSHGWCDELPVEGLAAAQVAAYLAERYTGSEGAAEFVRAVHERTDGNPFFMVNMLEYFVAQGVLGKRAGRWDLQAPLETVQDMVPESIRQMIEQQLWRLSPAGQRVLEAASVAGVEFATVSVAAALEEDVLNVEEQCAALARQQHFLRPLGMTAWPDGTVAALYGFRHWLYQHQVYHRVGVARRVRLHQRIGQRLEEAYGAQAGAIAAELAMHFDQSRDYPRAITYLLQTAENAARRYANREALAHLTRGLELLKTLPATRARRQQELRLHLALGASLIATKGYMALEVAQTYTRARHLYRHLDDPQQLFPALRGLWVYYLTRAELQTAHALGVQLLTLAQQAHDAAMLLEAHRAMGATLLYLGAGAAALTHLAQGMALYNRQQPGASTFLYGDDTGVVCHSIAAWALCSLGYPDQGLARSHNAVMLAQQRAHPLSLGFALSWATAVHQYRWEVQAAQERAEAVISLATEQGFPFFRAFGSMLRGWALAHQGQAQEGIEDLRQGLRALQVSGVEIARLYFLALLAEAHGAIGQPEAGLEVLAKVLTRVDTTSDRWYEPEIYRLKGTLLLLQSAANHDAAQAWFHHALEAARAQQARSLELRTAVSLSRLWLAQGKRDEARTLLAPIYAWFTEGFDTADLQEAKALLAELVG